MENKKEVYVCMACNQEQEKGWTDDEAMEESKQLFGELPTEELAIVCDDCFRAMGFE